MINNLIDTKKENQMPASQSPNLSDKAFSIYIKLSKFNPKDLVKLNFKDSDSKDNYLSEKSMLDDYANQINKLIDKRKSFHTDEFIEKTMNVFREILDKLENSQNLKSSCISDFIKCEIDILKSHYNPFSFEPTVEKFVLLTNFVEKSIKNFTQMKFNAIVNIIYASHHAIVLAFSGNIDDSYVNNKNIYLVSDEAIALASSKVVQPPFSNFRLAKNMYGFPSFLIKPNFESVVQSTIGNCWLLASVISILAKEPNFFDSIIADYGNKTIVKLRTINKKKPSFFCVQHGTPCSDYTFSENSSICTALLNEQTIAPWLERLQKAIAFLLTHDNIKANAIPNSIWDLTENLAQTFSSYIIGPFSSFVLLIDKSQKENSLYQKTFFNLINKVIHAEGVFPLSCDKKHSYALIDSYTSKNNEIILTRDPHAYHAKLINHYSQAEDSNIITNSQYCDPQKNGKSEWILFDFLEKFTFIDIMHKNLQSTISKLDLAKSMHLKDSSTTDCNNSNSPLSDLKSNQRHILEPYCKALLKYYKDEKNVEKLYNAFEDSHSIIATYIDSLPYLLLLDLIDENDLEKHVFRDLSKLDVYFNELHSIIVKYFYNKSDKETKTSFLLYNFNGYYKTDFVITQDFIFPKETLDNNISDLNLLIDDLDPKEPTYTDSLLKSIFEYCYKTIAALKDIDDSKLYEKINLISSFPGLRPIYFKPETTSLETETLVGKDLVMNIISCIFLYYCNFTHAYSYFYLKNNGIGQSILKDLISKIYNNNRGYYDILATRFNSIIISYELSDLDDTESSSLLYSDENSKNNVERKYL